MIMLYKIDKQVKRKDLYKKEDPYYARFTQHALY